MENKNVTMYCKECGKDIGIQELDDGTIIVKCPKCVGECAICHCHLVDECFADSPLVRTTHPYNHKNKVNG